MTVKAMKICVIGAGSSGLTAIKACKEEGMDVDCFEMSDDFGGLWRYHDDDPVDRPSVMKSTVINSSKEMSAFSDFPPPKEFANYMHNTCMLEYFRLYAERFDLTRHVRYSSKVVKVEMSDDYPTTGRWTVTVQDLETGSTSTEVYDGVMVCSGHHAFPQLPHFVGLEDFQGRVTHTQSLKSSRGYEDKKVLVIGIGNSGVDAATELGRVAEKLYLSTRGGSWIVSRMAIGGTPADMFFSTRIFSFLREWNPLSIVDTILEFYLNLKADHSRYGLRPMHRLLSAHPTHSDVLPNCILSGQVVMKQNVRSFGKTGVVFEGEKEATEVDDVILATGYEIKFPFLSEDVLKVRRNSSDLYKLVFPVHLAHPSLAFIGLIQPVGSIFPIAEAQSRWYAQLMRGTCSLPSTAEMKEEVKRRREEMSKRYVDSLRHTIQVDYVPYMDEIYAEIGAKPALWKLALKDPALFYACLVKACAPYQYRLQGPHAWDGAREAILSMSERVEYPFRLRKNYAYP